MFNYLKLVLPQALALLVLISPLIWLAAVISIVDNLNVNSLPKHRICLCIGLIAWAILTLLFYNLNDVVAFCGALTLNVSLLGYFLLKKLKR